MIVKYKRAGKVTTIEIPDTHDWADVLPWIMVKMGHTGMRTDDALFDKIMREKNGPVLTKAHPRIKRR